mmetsp:Transcript_9608/g.25217  ORF Transcript_9608/g.25217 Transcript_9608/m.25217 type:complete len:295 (+) Transcript_9608:291-1175(+)
MAPERREILGLEVGRGFPSETIGFQPEPRRGKPVPQLSIQLFLYREACLECVIGRLLRAERYPGHVAIHQEVGDEGLVLLGNLMQSVCAQREDTPLIHGAFLLAPLRVILRPQAGDDALHGADPRMRAAVGVVQFRDRFRRHLAIRLFRVDVLRIEHQRVQAIVPLARLPRAKVEIHVAQRHRRRGVLLERRVAQQTPLKVIRLVRGERPEGSACRSRDGTPREDLVVHSVEEAGEAGHEGIGRLAWPNAAARPERRFRGGGGGRFVFPEIFSRLHGLPGHRVEFCRVLRLLLR